MKKIYFILFFFGLSLGYTSERLIPEVFEASLSTPLSTLKTIFPGTETFKAYSLSRANHYPRNKLPALERKIRSILASRLDETYENSYTHYIFYDAFDANKKFLGTLTGCNIPTLSGIHEVFVAIAASGRIQDVYVQNIAGASAEINRKLFQDSKYRKQFRNLAINVALEETTVEALAAPPGVLATKPVVIAHLSVMRAVRLGLIVFEEVYRPFKERIESHERR